VSVIANSQRFFLDVSRLGCVLERQLVSPECDNTDQRNLEGLSRWFDSGEKIVNFLKHDLATKCVDAEKKFLAVV
jgi:hypothetical protein